MQEMQSESNKIIKALFSILLKAHHEKILSCLMNVDMAARHGGQVLLFHQKQQLATVVEMVHLALIKASESSIPRLKDSEIPMLPQQQPQNLDKVHIEQGSNHSLCAQALLSALQNISHLPSRHSTDLLADFIKKIVNRVRADFIQARNEDCYHHYDDHYNKAENDDDGREGGGNDGDGGSQWKEYNDITFSTWSKTLVSALETAMVSGSGELNYNMLPPQKHVLDGFMKKANELLDDNEFFKRYLTRRELDDSCSFALQDLQGAHALPAGNEDDVLSEIRQLTMLYNPNLMPVYQEILTLLSEKNSRQRTDFIDKLNLQPPARPLRLIDCKSTIRERKVVITDWCEKIGYMAVSHTYGMEVYKVFDCQCASEYRGANRCRCNALANCTHETHELRESHKKVIGDIVRMCEIVVENCSATEYLWHDGVCIAQYDTAELDETITHMGWIYANAYATIIFLHYIGSPMAPIAPDGDLEARWHTRVWNLQEAVLSRNRLYCVRLGHKLLESNGMRPQCQTFQNFKAHLTEWYQDNTSAVCVLEENQFMALLITLLQTAPLTYFDGDAAQMIRDGLPKPIDQLREVVSDITVLQTWRSCLWQCYAEVGARNCLRLPDLETILEICSQRDSKHEGDRINSILALAEVKDFTADKDEKLEETMIQFLKRQGKQGLACALC